MPFCRFTWGSLPFRKATGGLSSAAAHHQAQQMGGIAHSLQLLQADGDEPMEVDEPGEPANSVALRELRSVSMNSSVLKD